MPPLLCKLRKLHYTNRRKVRKDSHSVIKSLRTKRWPSAVQPYSFTENKPTNQQTLISRHVQEWNGMVRGGEFIVFEFSGQLIVSKNYSLFQCSMFLTSRFFLSFFFTLQKYSWILLYIESCNTIPASQQTVILILPYCGFFIHSFILWASTKGHCGAVELTQTISYSPWTHQVYGKKGQRDYGQER